MKAKALLYAAVAAIISLSCTREVEMTDNVPNGGQLEIHAAWEEANPAAGSRTVLAENGTDILWSSGDEIKVFYGSRFSGRFTSSNTEPQSLVTFSGTLTMVTGSMEQGNESSRYWAVYPYNNDNSCDNQSVTITLPHRQKGKAGTFVDKFFPAIAVSATPDLAFYNVCGGARFSVTQEGIVRAVFRSNDGSPMAGIVKVGFGEDNTPQIIEITEPVDSVVVNATEGGFSTGENYFAAMLPQTHAEGLSITLYTTTQRAAKTIGNAITVKRSVFGVLDNVDEGLTDWEEYAQEAEGGGTRSGLYLGIIGFNQQLYTMPIERLTAASQTRFNTFIDGLTAKKGTLLYYSVDKSIRTLSRAAYPDNLFNVSLVTFTDGLDQGSAMMIEDYPGDDEYLQELNTRLSTEQVKGLPLTAYSVGLKGSDVTDAAKFSNNLQKLANPSSNAFEVSSMSAVNSRFQAIAEQVSQTLTKYSYDLSISIPGPANGTRVRFTLDNVSSATSSNLYIEGVFNLQSKSLTGVTCQGLTLPAGDTVQGEVDGIFVRFPFNGVVVGDGKSNSLSQSNIKHWNYITSTAKWQKNSEFDAENDASVEVTTIKRSAVILLNLDCSSSLGSDFSTLKTHAKSFIDRLYQASIDPYEVTGVSLDKTALTLYEGTSATLTVTVTPSTAANKNVIWSSSDAAVATVNPEGVVAAVSAGTAVITVTTVDGGFTAECTVTVTPIPEMVDLGLPSGLKWASFNLGATKPEEYGDYFAWGEVEPNWKYNWSTYKWCKGSDRTMTKYCNKSDYGYNGFTDNKRVLDLEDDAAAVNLGGSWRMATYAEWDELETKCTWTWATQNGVNGYWVTGPNGNSIFLSAAGYRDGTSLSNAGSNGYYWSSSLNTVTPNYAYCVSFNSSNVGWGGNYRYRGQSVRPVSE